MSKQTFKVIEHLEKAFPNQPIDVMRTGEGEHARYVISMTHNPYLPLERDVLGKALGIENGKQQIQRCESSPEISYNIAIPPHTLKAMLRAARGDAIIHVEFKQALLHHIGNQGHLFIPNQAMFEAGARFTNAQGASNLDAFDALANGDRIIDRYTIDATPIYEAVTTPGSEPETITIKGKEYAGMYTVTMKPREKLVNGTLTRENPIYEPTGMVKNFLKLDAKNVLVMNATRRSSVMFSVDANTIDIALDNLDAIAGPPPMPGVTVSAKGRGTGKAS